MLEKTVEIGLLFDYYGKLLTEKQQEAMKLYYYHDLSLGEIAEKLKISRQGVYDHLHRGENILRDYEKKIGIIKRYNKLKEKIDYLIKDIDEIDIPVEKKYELRDEVKDLKKYL